MTAAENVRRQRTVFRPYGLFVLAVVIATSHASLRTAAPLAVFAAAMLVVLAERAIAPAIAALAAASIALAVLEPGLAGPQIAGGAAVWLAVIRFGVPRGAALAGVTTAGLVLAVSLRGHADLIVSIVLADVLLGVVGQFVRTTRRSERRLERLLAELEAAREEQVASAALAERSRIARELHDVLAHALSGAAIQLQGARVLAERIDASDDVRTAIDRATELVREGLGSAREAVDALRGDALPGVAQLPALVDGTASFAVAGDARPLPPELGLALYRTVQEALTNASRYAAGAPVSVLLRYEPDAVHLIVENGVGERRLDGVGGGHGLAGLRERVAQLGGSLEAGPAGDGWRVAAEVPG